MTNSQNKIEQIAIAANVLVWKSFCFLQVNQLYLKTLQLVFSCEHCKIFKNTYSTEDLRAASVFQFYEISCTSKIRISFPVSQMLLVMQ